MTPNPGTPTPAKLATPTGCLTDIPGISVGHFTSPLRPTGCTVVLYPPGATCGVDVRGAAPGTRETDLLKPENTVEQVHAVLLTGGSAFGLDAATGVMRWLDESGHGLLVGDPARGIRVPIVPAAVLFDLFVGDHRVRPDADAGYAACQAATSPMDTHTQLGAGAGATVGKFLGPTNASKGGIGSASIRWNGFTVAALVAVNAMGDVVDPNTGNVLAGVCKLDGSGFANTVELLQKEELFKPVDVGQSGKNAYFSAHLTPGQATTIGVVATDAVLTKAQAKKIAQMAHDGLARTINPIHTPFDGDTLFAMGTGGTGKRADITALGTLAALVTAQAVLHAVSQTRPMR